MKTLIVNSIVTLSLVAIGLSACSKAGNNVAANKVQSSNAKASQEASSFEYVSIEGFSYDLAKFVGLVEGETFAESEVKINAVFKAYDGHANPLDIRMESDIVEAGWKQVLVTQDGLMDGTVTGQQLLAVYDDEKKLISYGMRIKCFTESGSSDWQIEICE